MKCIICGAEFPEQMVKLPQRLKSKPLIYRKEVCDRCVSLKQESEHKIYRFPDAPLHGYIDLAADIMKGVANEYEIMYKDALKSIIKYGNDYFKLTTEEAEFLRLHKQLIKSAYHDSISLGNTANILYSVRLEVEKNYKPLVDSGYDIFEREMKYGKRNNKPDN